MDDKFSNYFDNRWHIVIRYMLDLEEHWRVRITGKFILFNTEHLC